MEKNLEINLKLLKEQVYDYLKKQILTQDLQPGSAINMDATSKKLGISKTPLRDALIQLEMEGFVSIIPRRGIYVNVLKLENIKEFYQVIGSLEAESMRISFPLLKDNHIKRMQVYNHDMMKAIDQNEFAMFYKNNIDFHSLYIDLAGNSTMSRIIDNLKKRLYDFPLRSKWIKEWEVHSISEHQQLISALQAGDVEAAIHVIHDIHWNFDRHVDYIRRYYFSE